MYKQGVFFCLWHNVYSNVTVALHRHSKEYKSYLGGINNGKRNMERY